MQCEKVAIGDRKEFVLRFETGSAPPKSNKQQQRDDPVKPRNGQGCQPNAQAPQQKEFDDKHRGGGPEVVRGVRPGKDPARTQFCQIRGKQGKTAPNQKCRDNENEKANEHRPAEAVAQEGVGIIRVLDERGPDCYHCAARADSSLDEP